MRIGPRGEARNCVVVLGAMLAGILAAAPSSMMTPTPCGGSDNTSSGIISQYRAWATGTDTQTVRIRKVLSLPATTSDSVVLVSDPTVCRRARSLYVKDVASDTLRIPTVYTLRIGSTRYVVSDRRIHGRWAGDLIIDTSFVVIVFNAG